MKHGEITNLVTFVAVVEEYSFTRAVARLSMTQSASGQIVRYIEERSGSRLLTRTMRSIIPIEADEYPLSVLSPMLRDIDSALASLNELQNRPSGIIRITTVEHAAKTILLPAMRTFLKSHPEIDIQLTINYGLTDVVSERFGTGVYLGGRMDKDMIAIRTRLDIPTVIAGSPNYFSRRSVPTSMSQLIDHQTTSLYLPTSDAANRWRLIRGGRKVRAHMEGQLLLNTIDLTIDVAIDGHGLAYLPYDQVKRTIKEKELIRVLDEFTSDLLGYHLYCPHRRHAGSAFPLFINRLKYKGAV